MDNETIVLINNEGLYNENQLEKLFALKALKKNPGILGNVHTFQCLCYVLNGIKPNVTSFEPVTLLNIVKAVNELKMGEDFDWHDEIRQYIAHLAFEEGWINLPEILKFSQEQLDELNCEFEMDEDIQKMQELKHEAVKRYLQ